MGLAGKGGGGVASGPLLPLRVGCVQWLPSSRLPWQARRRGDQLQWSLRRALRRWAEGERPPAESGRSGRPGFQVQRKRKVVSRGTVKRGRLPRPVLTPAPAPQVVEPTSASLAPLKGGAGAVAFVATAATAQQICCASAAEQRRTLRCSGFARPSLCSLASTAQAGAGQGPITRAPCPMRASP